MIKFREKWLASLLFAILLHLGVFFILYVNTSENDIAHSNKTTVNHSVTTSGSGDYSPIKTQTHINTLDATKSLYESDHSQGIELDSSKKPEVYTDETKPIKSVENSDTDPSYSIKTENTSNKKLQKNNNESNKDTIMPVTSVLSSNNSLAGMKDDVALLNIDTPIHNSKPQMDSEYNLIKAEIEENNHQLSKAINEVKKRNQQKIEERQKQQAITNNYIHNNEYKESSTEEIK